MAVNDEERISLHLDGRLSEPLEPRLRERLEEAQRLQAMAAGLSFTSAGFTADDVRERLGRRKPRRAGWIAAAVLLLAVSHWAAFRLGHEPAERDPIAETEQFLRRATLVDAGAPVEQLETELADLRGFLRASDLPFRLAAEEGPRAAQLEEGLVQLETAFEQYRDPGFLGILVSRIGREYLEGMPATRFVPSSVDRYARVTSLGDGRYRVTVVRSGEGMHVHEGTREELREAGIGVQLIGGE